MIKRIISIIMCAVLLLTAIPLTAFAVGEKTVIDSGTCGMNLEDDLKWTFFNSGELVISGQGNMDWYSPIYGKLPPWYEYRDRIQVVTVEEGVYSIGSFAFNFGKNKEKQYPLCRINLPLSIAAIEDNIIDDTVYDSYRKFAVCYPGTEDNWNRIAWQLWATNRGVTVYEDHKDYWLWRKLVKYGDDSIFKNWNIFYNGEQPEPYCDLGNENVTTQTDQESMTIRAEYYLDKYQNVDFVWSVEGDSQIIETRIDRYGVENVVSISGFERGNAVVKLDIVTPDGKVIASDQKTISSRKIASGDSALTAFKKIFLEVDHLLSIQQANFVFLLVMIIMQISYYFGMIFK